MNEFLNILRNGPVQWSSSETKLLNYVLENFHYMYKEKYGDNPPEYLVKLKEKINLARSQGPVGVLAKEQAFVAGMRNLKGWIDEGK